MNWLEEGEMDGYITILFIDEYILCVVLRCCVRCSWNETESHDLWSCRSQIEYCIDIIQPGMSKYVNLRIPSRLNSSKNHPWAARKTCKIRSSQRDIGPSHRQCQSWELGHIGRVDPSGCSSIELTIQEGVNILHKTIFQHNSRCPRIDESGISLSCNGYSVEDSILRFDFPLSGCVG